MAHHAEILLGLDAGATRLVGVAFTPDGQEVARAARPSPVDHGAGGAAEQSPVETWQCAAAVLRQLARQVPGLARRTLALALTGPPGGCWLCDEDGDPVGPALLPLDRQAEALVARWRAAGFAREIARVTGEMPDPSSQCAQLAWLATHRMDALERAASVFCGKDWLYFCLTGERASEATAALAAFGNLESGAYDVCLLERLGLGEAARLLPVVVDGMRHQDALAPAAAAATGLLPGTPVVLGPVDSVARSLAAGLAAAADDLGASDPGPGGLHVRAGRERPSGQWTDRGVAIRRFAGLWLAFAAQPRTIEPDWLVGLAEELLADAGLIGVPRSELVARLEHKAAAAAAGRVRCRNGGGATWTLGGLSGATTFYDLLRASHEAVGSAAAAGYATLDHRPSEIRIVAERPPSPVMQEALGARLGARVRPLLRAAPAAAGAALTAALSLGLYPDLAAADADWVAPHLGPPSPRREAQIALAPLSSGRMAPVTRRDSSDAR